MHAWFDPFERVVEIGGQRGVALSTPLIGVRIDLCSPQPRSSWWQAVGS